MKSEPLAEANGSALLHEQPSRPFEVEDEQGWRLQRSQFEAIAASDEIRGMLKDPELQLLIRNIDRSSDVQKDLNIAMEGELFREFRDKILAILNPEQE